MISVIIPIYGVEQYIERCARSVLEQTYNDIEFIFVNDCTKDYSMEILQKVISDYPNRNVRIINKPKNEGLPQARKTGFLASKGKYIIHFDSDDWVESDYIEKMYISAVKNDSDIVIAHYYENYTDKQVVIEGPQFDMASDGINMMLRAQLHSGVWNKLARREMYEGLEFPIANMHEDLVIMVQIFANVKKISFIDKPFYHYNLTNSGSLTSDEYSLRRASSVYENLKMIERILVNKDLFQKHEAAFCNFVNTFKGACMLRKATRKKEWLVDLYAPSSCYVFSENRISLIKKILLWGAFRNFFWPYKLIDFIR